MVKVDALPKHMLAGIRRPARMENFDPVAHKAGAEIRLTWMDAQPKPIRLLIHEFGIKTVRRHLEAGVLDAETIRARILHNRFIRDLDLTL